MILMGHLRYQIGLWEVESRSVVAQPWSQQTEEMAVRLVHRYGSISLPPVASFKARSMRAREDEMDGR